MGEGSRGLGKNQRGLRVGCCEMVGNYYEDSSVEENLNLLLRLTRVEANIDLKNEGEGVLEGRLQESRMLGASAATPSNDRLLREFKDEVLQGSAHSRVVRRLKEIQGLGRIK